MKSAAGWEGLLPGGLPGGNRANSLEMEREGFLKRQKTISENRKTIGKTVCKTDNGTGGKWDVFCINEQNSRKFQEKDEKTGRESSGQKS
ncbi:hypothetical protein [uncultured Oscillibacter sp.]|uniref:hypothetical protein n=1 Tax=uncultured Oscillibacter sp. TaxID=876091 RepID=UPI0025DEB0BB|nr:hypothetical protein [uncultured Oscillibacter sp.]